MTNPTNHSASPWSAAPSAKLKSAIQRSVTALLDELAPQRVLKRVEQLQGPVEQHRTPHGCVLQAATCAVSVSWFPDVTKQSALGELHILVWRGKVTRRGTITSPKKAELATEFVLVPIEQPVDDCLWLAPDGLRYGTAMLAAKCLALLQEQMSLQA